MFDVICIGNLNFDIIFNNANFPDIHEKMQCEDVFTGLGGAAGNTASWLARLNHKVGYIGCVGKDPAGMQHLAAFENFGIDTSQIKITDKNTGLAVIFSKGTDKRMVKSAGANAELTVDENYLQSTRLVHLSGNRRDIVEKVINICKKNTVKLSYDPGETKYADLFKFVDYLILNEDEAKRVTKTDSIDSAISRLSADTRIITKNGGGCLIEEKGQRFSIESPGASPIDTTGAGDAFDAGFIHGLLNNMPVEKCGKLGVSAATLSVQKKGARSGDISMASLNKLSL